MYGAEAREKYGDEDVDIAMNKILSISEEGYEKFKNLGKKVKEALKAAVISGAEPESEIGRSITALHKEWLGYSWKEYDAQKHKGVVSLYMTDERFKKYYDAEQDGCSEFLLNAVMFWSGKI